MHYILQLERLDNLIIELIIDYMYKFLRDEIKTTEVLFRIDEDRVILYIQVDGENKQTQSWQAIPIEKIKEILDSKPGTFIEFNSRPGGTTRGVKTEDFRKYSHRYII